MTKAFEAAETEPLGAGPLIQGGRIEVVGEDRVLVVGAERQTIGRAPHCSLVLDDETVSAVHAEVRGTATGMHLLDLKSKNGTRFGGARITEVVLEEPVEFRCGRRLLRYTPTVAVEAPPTEARPMRFGPLVGTSAAMREVFAFLEKFAATNLNILITGETGTGKEVVAHAIHAASPRRHKPLVPVNCGALNEHVLESELFGHVRGAFTDASRDRDGLFVEADGGTLFLDEVGEMGPELQKKLLRVIEDGLVRPVGGSAVRKVDVRVIAATNRDIRLEMNDEQFRTDLFFRLARVPLHLPPLRDRLEDVPLLVHEILRDLERPDVIVDEGTMRVLQSRSWPGNVRELVNFINMNLVSARDGRLSLGGASRSGASAGRTPQAPIETVMPRMTWMEAKSELKRRYYTALWASCRGNVTAMAKRAGVARSSARDALARMGFEVGPGGENEK